MKKLICLIILMILLALVVPVMAAENYDNYMDSFSVTASSSIAVKGLSKRTSRTKATGFNPSFAYNVYTATFPATGTPQICDVITPRSNWTETYKGDIYFLTEPGQTPIVFSGAERYGYK